LNRRRRVLMTAKGKGSSDASTPTVRAEYRATLEGLYQRRRFGLRPGLDVIRELLAALGSPERTYPAVHVTGSKGKGSVAAMAQSVLSASGLRTALFTSPHLESYRERIRVDDRTIEPSAVVEGVRRVDAAADQLEASGRIERSPTFFEVTTALALDWFARERAQAAVVEVGIGGRLDATNVLDARVGVVTTLELEHTDVLGPTLEAIAFEKAGIFHPGMTGVVGELPPSAATVVEKEAARNGVPLWHLGTEVRVSDRVLSETGQAFSVRLPGELWEGLEIPLLGRFQPGNAALALASARRLADALGRSLPEEAVRSGLRSVRWRARLERIARRPELYYDVAHTPESARSVAQSLAEIAPLADPTTNAVVFGCLRGKDVPRILEAFATLAHTLVVVPVRSERGLPPAEIRAAASGRFPRIVEAPTAADGLRLGRLATGPEGFTLVVGSDYLIGELLRDPDDDEPDLSDPGLGEPSSRARSVPTTRPARGSQGRPR
jgi:dihydrofolate synthase / folylpolyglutamate synthase